VIAAEEIDLARRRAEFLLGYFWHEHPRVFQRTGALDDWGAIGPGLYTQCAYLLESVVAARDRPIDAGILARCLWEHVVTFAWLAIDPSVYLPQWVRHEAKERQAMVSDLRKAGYEVPSEAIDTARTYSAFARGVEGHFLSAIERAEAADNFWGRYLPEVFAQGGRYSFRGQYALLFRGYSAWLHPRIIALQEFGSEVGPSRVQIGRPQPTGPKATTGAPHLFCMALVVGADRLGWPCGAGLKRCLEAFAPEWQCA